MEQEIWKPIEGYEGLYEVSNLGRVRSLDRIQELIDGRKRIKYGQIVCPCVSNTGYHIIKLYRDRKKKRYQLHRLVAKAFIPNPENKPQIDHINAIKTDNRIENLRWVTSKENSNNPITCKRLSEAKKGVPWSEERKLLYADKYIKGENHPWYGKHHSEESLIKMRKIVIQLSVTGELINEWKYAEEAAMILGFKRSSIQACCRGEFKTYKGYKWIYKEDYDNTNTRKA